MGFDGVWMDGTRPGMSGMRNRLMVLVRVVIVMRKEVGGLDA